MSKNSGGRSGYESKSINVQVFDMWHFTCVFTCGFAYCGCKLNHLKSSNGSIIPYIDMSKTQSHLTVLTLLNIITSSSLAVNSFINQY